MSSVKILQTLAAIACIVVQPIADFNGTHVFNPLWEPVPHAVFHTAWLMCGTVMMGLVTMYLVWGTYEGQGTRLAVVMASVLPIIAWGAFLPALMFPGVDHWPDGTPPSLPINPNLVMASLVVILSLAAMVIDKKSRV